MCNHKTPPPKKKTTHGGGIPSIPSIIEPRMSSLRNVETPT
jgi:hypothetical protein